MKKGLKIFLISGATLLAGAFAVNAKMNSDAEDLKKAVEANGYTNVKVDVNLFGDDTFIATGLNPGETVTGVKSEFLGKICPEYRGLYKALK